MGSSTQVRARLQQNLLHLPKPTWRAVQNDSKLDVRNPHCSTGTFWEGPHWADCEFGVAVSLELLCVAFYIWGHCGCP